MGYVCVRPCSALARITSPRCLPRRTRTMFTSALVSIAALYPSGALPNVSPADTIVHAAPRSDNERLMGVRSCLNRALRGKAKVVEQVLACLLARGHLLLEDL